MSESSQSSQKPTAHKPFSLLPQGLFSESPQSSQNKQIPGVSGLESLQEVILSGVQKAPQKNVADVKRHSLERALRVDRTSESTLHVRWETDLEISKLIRSEARKLSRQKCFRPSDVEDLEQEFRLVLVKKAHKYDSSRGKFQAFAATVIKSKAASLVRAAKAEKRAGSSATVSLNDKVAGEEGTVELASLLEERLARRHTGQQALGDDELVDLKDGLRFASTCLPTDLKTLAAVLGHTNQLGAAQVLGVSRREVAKGIAALHECFEAVGLNA